MFDPAVFLLDYQHVDKLYSPLGSKQGGREAAQRVPHTVLSNGGWHNPEHKCGYDHDVAWQEGQNTPLQPVMHPGVPDGTEEANDLDHISGQVRDGHSWVSTDQGAGRERDKDGEKERKGMVKRVD